MSTTSPQVDTGVIVRRSLFFVLLIILTLGNLFVLFRGLNTPQSMDQAQIAREIARGNGFTTKMIRPVAFWQAEKAKGGTIEFKHFSDTYHAPLNPLITGAVLKLIGADDSDQWKMGPKELVFPLDRIIAAISTMFFLMAIGVNYLLISRIFDAKIAGWSAVLMLFCEMNWNFALSGLPQMLMLLLFSCGLFFAYRAVDATSEERVAMTPALIAGAFFTLMVLTHWITVWIVFGYIIFAAIMFRPRGIVAVSISAILIIAVAYPMIRASKESNHPFGTAMLVLYNGLAQGGTESTVMRTDDLEANPLSLDGLIFKICRTTIVQGSDIIPFLGGIVVAPVFFLALLHPFKRQSIATFRWLILLMWVFAAFGMSLFGVTSTELHPNQIHILFAPIMTAYGLAFISILWSRLDLASSSAWLRDAHYIGIAIICSAPLLLTLPDKVRIGLQQSNQGGRPEWPPYYPPALNLGIKKCLGQDQIVVSDQPWAVAWYADRMSVWLPTTEAGFRKLEDKAALNNTPFDGILISPSSYNSEKITDVAAHYHEFASLVLDGNVIAAVSPSNTFALFENDPKLTSISKRYSYRNKLLYPYLIYYSERRIDPDHAKEQE